MVASKKEKLVSVKLIRTKPLPQIMAIAKNLALNLYRNAGVQEYGSSRTKM